MELSVFVLVGRTGFETECVRDRVSCEMAVAGLSDDSVVRGRFLELSSSNCATDVWLGLEVSVAGFSGLGGGTLFETELVVVVEDTLPVLPVGRTGRAGGGVAAFNSIEPFPPLPSPPAGRLPFHTGATIVLRGGGGAGLGLPLLLTS